MNVLSNTERDNTLSKFSVIFPSAVELDKSYTWLVALQSLSFPNVVSNIPRLEEYIPSGFIISSAQFYSKTHIRSSIFSHFDVKPDKYLPQTLLIAFNKAIHKHVSPSDISFKYLPSLNKVVIVGTGEFVLLLQKNVIELLGFDYKSCVKYPLGGKYMLYAIGDQIKHDPQNPTKRHRLVAPHELKLKLYTSELVSVRLNEIKPHLSSHGYDKIITQHALQTSRLYHQFESDQLCYFELESNSISSLNFSLQDQNGHQLHLLPGKPTHIKLYIKPKKMSDTTAFHVRLNTNDSKAIFPDNTLDTFTVKLPYPITLGHKWQVALTSIMAPTAYQMYSNKDVVIGYKKTTENGDIVKEAFTPFLFNKYFSLEHLCLILHNLFQSLKVNIKFDCEGTRIRMSNNDNVYAIEIIFPWKLAYLLGYRQKQVVNGKISIHLRKGNISLADTDFDKDVFIPSVLMLYCNEVKPSYIGSLQAPILKCQPIMSSTSDNLYRTMEIKHLEFHDLSKTILTTLSFQLRDESGEPIVFEDEYNQESVSINLVFREKKK